jgi:hypothetical protein
MESRREEEIRILSESELARHFYLDSLSIALTCSWLNQTCPEQLKGVTLKTLIYHLPNITD